VLLVDAANVVGSRPTGWWRDRPKAARELIERIRAATAAGQIPAPVVVVLEGQARPGVAPGVTDGVQVVHATGEGDDTLARLAEEASEPVTMVTADRGLAERARRAGAAIVGPNWLYERLPDAG
jgi:rRNA-processing protein FCF1